MNHRPGKSPRFAPRAWLRGGGASLSLLLLLAGAADAQTNWPSFRGVNASGHAAISEGALYYRTQGHVVAIK